MLTRKQLIKNLENLGLNNAIADEYATLDGKPAVLIERDGRQMHYVGDDLRTDGTDEVKARYAQWLKENFAQ